MTTTEVRRGVDEVVYIQLLSNNSDLLRETEREEKRASFE